MEQLQLSKGTGGSVVVERCQICHSTELKDILFLGDMPPVNEMQLTGCQPKQIKYNPANLLFCNKCGLVQLGLIVDPEEIFPADYSFKSGTTSTLRQNFKNLFQECCSIIELGRNDLILDIGSNDGTLLKNFKEKGFQVLGIEPTDVADRANGDDITTLKEYFAPEVAKEIFETYGKAKLITATNVFAHVENVHSIINSMLELLDEDGVFVSESHYLISLLDDCQYDKVTHEHLRFYSVNSLQYVLNSHGLEIFRVSQIPTHGGSIRAYACRKGMRERHDSVKTVLDSEPVKEELQKRLYEFRNNAHASKLNLLSLFNDLKSDSKNIVGIGAPSRAFTLINFIGIDEYCLDYVCEVSGSSKIGKNIPGTLIPIVDEKKMYEESPDYALILSWHIAAEIIPKIRERGFEGKFIIPLPQLAVID